MIFNYSSKQIKHDVLEKC